MAAIGVYDSGVGGISVLRALREVLPGEAFVYVADSRHAPYGEQTQDFLEARADAVVGFLVREVGVKAVVLACNTVSVAAAAALRATYGLPIVAMEPAIKPAVAATRSGTVLVLATTHTIESRAVERLCERFGAQAHIVLQPCPGLADQVERGEFSSASTDELLARYLGPGLAAGADTVVLGCTHYAFLAAGIGAHAGPGVAVIEPSPAVARQLAARLDETAAAQDGPAPPATTFYTSGAIERLRDFLARVDEPAATIHPLPL
jgi:glutamate racemase